MMIPIGRNSRVTKMVIYFGIGVDMYGNGCILAFINMGAPRWGSFPRGGLGRALRPPLLELGATWEMSALEKATQ